MKTIMKVFSAVVVMGMMAACAPSVMVRSDYDRTANFSRYRTYSIAPVTNGNTDPVMGSQLMQKRISQALDAEMQARGYKKVEKNADLVVKFDTDARNLQQIQSNNMAPMWGWWWYGPNNNVSSRNYEENRLIVNLVDGKNNELIWQGWAKGELNARRKNRDELIQKTVTKVMAEYPHRAGMNHTELISNGE